MRSLRNNAARIFDDDRAEIPKPGTACAEPVDVNGPARTVGHSAGVDHVQALAAARPDAVLCWTGNAAGGQAREIIARHGGRTRAASKANEQEEQKATHGQTIEQFGGGEESPYCAAVTAQARLRHRRRIVNSSEYLSGEGFEPRPQPWQVPRCPKRTQSCDCRRGPGREGPAADQVPHHSQIISQPFA